MSLKTMLRALRGASADQSETGKQFAENSFSYLAAHPSIPNWKRKLYSLIEGESDETLTRLGSIEEYVRVLLAESEGSEARYCLSEALSQIVQEWTPTVAEHAERLYNMLGLIAGFTPPGGFVKTFDYLNSCGGIKRREEQVSSEPYPVDLYKKGLGTLGRYYPIAPQQSQNDQGFQSYVQLLKKNLEDPNYAGYVVGRLLELNLLNIKSEKISALLLSNEGVMSEVFRRLLDAADEPEAVPSVEARLGELLTVCARTDSLDKFESAAAVFDATFNPEKNLDDELRYLPTLTLSDGRVLNIFLNMDEVKNTALAYYMAYNKERLGELLASGSIEPAKLGKYVSGYLAQIISDEVSVEALIQELSFYDVYIVTNKNKFVLGSRKRHNIKNVPVELEEEVFHKFLPLWMKSTHKMGYAV
jgi:hypothetical protein